MIYRDTKTTVKGVTNRSQEFTAKRHVQAYASSLSDLIQWIETTPRKWDNHEASHSGGRDHDWDLGAGWEGAATMAKEGWSEGAADLDARLQAIMPRAGGEARYGYAPSGSSVNVGRFVTGHPNCMKSRKRKESGSAPVYHIVINGNASAMITADQMKNYGTALVGLIDRLESTGKRVMVDILYVLKEGEARCALGWNVKQAAEHIDLSAMAFSIAHPAAFRRLGFAMIERTPGEYQNGGYGMCADIAEVDLLDTTDGVMLIDGVNHEPGRCNSPKDALRFAIEQINKAAVLAGHATVDDPLIPDDEDLFA